MNLAVAERVLVAPVRAARVGDPRPSGFLVQVDLAAERTERADRDEALSLTDVVHVDLGVAGGPLFLGDGACGRLRDACRPTRLPGVAELAASWVSCRDGRATHAHSEPAEDGEELLDELHLLVGLGLRVLGRILLVPDVLVDLGDV